jgi:hypothetical protein
MPWATLGEWRPPDGNHGVGARLRERLPRRGQVNSDRMPGGPPTEEQPYARYDDGFSADAPSDSGAV